MRELISRTPAEIGREWDKVALERFHQIVEGRDRSYLYTLCPFFEERASKTDFKSILDVGCGVGYLTHRLASYGVNVTGIDLSRRSIEIAKANFDGVEFILGDVVEVPVGEFDLVVANMVLMDYPDLRSLTEKIARSLRPGGTFLATIPNPYVWPRYWRYEARKWFSYQREVAVEAEFKISTAGSAGGLTTHFHRPLATYLQEAILSGLQLNRFVELTGNDIAHRTLRKYPRFLAFEFTK